MTRKNQHERILREFVRQACLQAAEDAYEDAGIRGLCGDGRWECALAAMSDQSQAMKVKRGGHLTHVVVRRVDGTTFSYGDVWQRRNFLLVTLASSPGADEGAEAAYITALLAHDKAFQEYETTVVITRDAVAGVTSPAVLIADRWGEIITIECADSSAGLLPVEDVLEWLRFVAHACPECEGEAR